MIEDRPVDQQEICPQCGSNVKMIRNMVDALGNFPTSAKWVPCTSSWHITDEDGEFILHSIPAVLTPIAQYIHKLNRNWWINIETGEPLQRNVGETLMLVVSELSEALEGDRKGIMDDKLPHRTMFEVEIMDAIIRLLDICGGMSDHGCSEGQLDFQAMVEKIEFNQHRADHQIENRLKDNGKKF